MNTIEEIKWQKQLSNKLTAAPETVNIFNTGVHKKPKNFCSGKTELGIYNKPSSLHF